MKDSKADDACSNDQRDATPEGFAKVQNDIFRDRSLHPHVRYVYVCLVGYANQHRIAWPSQAENVGVDTESRSLNRRGRPRCPTSKKLMRLHERPAAEAVS